MSTHGFASDDAALYAAFLADPASGTYHNPVQNRYEMWAVHHGLGRALRLGGCQAYLPEAARQRWERELWDCLQAMPWKLREAIPLSEAPFFVRVNDLLLHPLTVARGEN